MIRKLIIITMFLFFLSAKAQLSWIQKNTTQIGLKYGTGKQGNFLFEDTDYVYEFRSFKLASHFLLKHKNNHQWELLVEPTYYQSSHELYNYWYIGFKYFPTTEEQKTMYMTPKNFKEYALNLGLLYRYLIDKNLSVYGYGNIGPAYIDTTTERQSKGYAFSDIIALGIQYQLGQFSIDSRTFFRHSSSANILKPNNGLNALGFEMGINYHFKKPDLR